MSVMVWTEELSVGIEKIDDQHKKLIGLINKLYDAMKEGKGKESLNGILEETLVYTKYHFTTEEDMFRKFSYSQAESHVKEHRDLKAQVEKLYEDVQQGKSAISVEVFHFLKDWVTNHIMLTDMKYKNELKGKV